MNRIRELSKFMSGATLYQYTAMLNVMKFCLSTKNRGWLLKPDRTWNGSKDFKFRISGESDSDYNVDPDSRRSITGSITRLEGAAVAVRSKQQQCVTLSVTEAELIAAVETAQDMLYVKSVLESMDLQVQLPMILEVDNKGAVDLANNWSAAGRTRHVASRVYFLRELKEQGILEVKWRTNVGMPANVLTKNVVGAQYNSEIESLVGRDQYMEQKTPAVSFKKGEG
jgi:hypothetical protein